MPTAFTRFIISVDYGELDVTDGSAISCVVIWSDHTKEIVTGKARLIEIQEQLAAQQKAYLNK